jgi:hypothetical protein
MGAFSGCPKTFLDGFMLGLKPFWTRFPPGWKPLGGGAFYI